jgi:hypothetical protein
MQNPSAKVSLKVAIEKPRKEMKINVCYEFFQFLLATLGPGVYSASNRNKYLVSEHLAQNKGHGRF